MKNRKSFLEVFIKNGKTRRLLCKNGSRFRPQAKSVRSRKLKELESDPAYNKKVPNLLRSLVGAFAMGNRLGLNDISGDGYAYVADKIIEIDAYNPQVASRIAKSLNHLKRLDEKRKELLATQLERVLSQELSSDTYEVVYKNLKGQNWAR